MKVQIEKSFERDVNKIKDDKLLRKLLNIISKIEKAKSIYEIPQVKKIHGYNLFFRIKIGDYRLGLEELPGHGVSFIRFMHRKEIYRYFPYK